MISRYLITIAVLAVVLSMPAQAVTDQVAAAPVSFPSNLQGTTGQSGLGAGSVDPNFTAGQARNALEFQRQQAIADGKRDYDRRTKEFDERRRDYHKKLGVLFKEVHDLDVKIRAKEAKLPEDQKKMIDKDVRNLRNEDEQKLFKTYADEHFAGVDFGKLKNKAEIQSAIQKLQAKKDLVSATKEIIGAAHEQLEEGKDLTYPQLNELIALAFKKKPPPVDPDRPDELAPNEVATRLFKFSPTRTLAGATNTVSNPPAQTPAQHNQSKRDEGSQGTPTVAVPPAEAVVPITSPTTKLDVIKDWVFA